MSPKTVLFSPVVASAAVEPGLSRVELKELGVTQDGPGLVHFAVQVPLLVGFGTLTVAWAAAGHPAWIAAVIGCGLVLTTFFPALHECGHGTAFRTPWINRVGAAICAALMLQAPSFFREFHWEHHRSTQDRGRDPEIASAPDLLSPWPRNLLVYAALASGQLLWIGKLGFTIFCAVVPAGPRWDRAFPFIREQLRTRIAWESRLVLAALGGALYLGLAWVPGFAALLWAWPIAHLALGLYLIAEHTGLPHEGSQADRTRTVQSHAWVRWLMWNMPYHAEHHMHPAIPFHALPRLHARLRPCLPHVAPGYFAVHREALAHALGRRRKA
jgi:fatty acid desaturase